MSLFLKIILAVYVWSVITCYVIYVNRVKTITITWCRRNKIWYDINNINKPTVKTLPIFLVSMIPLANIGIIFLVCTQSFEKRMVELLNNDLKNIIP